MPERLTLAEVAAEIEREWLEIGKKAVIVAALRELDARRTLADVPPHYPTDYDNAKKARDVATDATDAALAALDAAGKGRGNG